VWGPNVSRLDKEITGRYAAATHIMAIIKDALANGQDTQPILKQIALTRYDPSNYQAKWEIHYGQRMLSPGPQTTLDGWIRYLEGLPVPPSFVPQSQ
jgi:hypothetical protein